MIDHGVIEIEIFLLWHADDCVVLSKHRIKLTAFSPEKSPGIIKAKRVRPTIERTGRTLLTVRRHMPLADGSSVVAVGLKNLRNRSGASRPIRAVPGPAAD